MGIAARLRGVAEEMCESLWDFATMAGLPYRSLQNYIRGERALNAEALFKIVDGQRINANWLLTGEGERFSRDYLAKPIVDKLVVMFLPQIVDLCIGKLPSQLSEDERRALMFYMIHSHSLGLGPAIQTLLPDDAKTNEQIRWWAEHIAAWNPPEQPSQKPQKRKRRKGP